MKNQIGKRFLKLFLKERVALMKLRRMILAAALIIPLAIFNPVAMAFDDNSRPLSKYSKNEYELIIVFGEQTDQSKIQQIKEKYGFTSSKTLKTSESQHMEIVTVPSSEGAALSVGAESALAERLAARLESDPGIAHVQPNYHYRLSDGEIPELSPLPNDPYLTEQWGLINSGQSVNGVSGIEGIDINADAAWDTTRGSNDVVVAVIDSGVWLNHPDLSDSIWTNDDEIPGNKIDDDDNGYIDDYYGWDFALDQPNQLDSPTVHTHGTHVAGIISAAGNNGSGISGAAPEAKIMSLNFMSRTLDGVSGTTSDAISAINYARDNGAMVINASWGGDSDDLLLKKAIEECGMVFVTAAGNRSLDLDRTPEYPAAYDLDNLVTVAAVNSSGLLASFSNYGAIGVDIAAPGTNILSTVSAGSDYVYDDNGFYTFMNGTSMAAPFVSGIAALQLAVVPDLTAAKTRMILLRSARPMASLTGKMVSGGIADANAALQLAMLENGLLFSVRFIDWDGRLLAEQIVDSGSSAVKPADPARTGYTFTGWDKSYLNVTENLILTAQYEINYYTVNFKDWDGKIVKSQSVPYLGNASAPTNPTRAGYIFTGWDSSFSKITQSIEVKAIYEEATVMFKSGSALSFDPTNSFITGITEGMTVEQLLGQLSNTSGMVSVSTSEGKAVSDNSTILSTGMILQLINDKTSDRKTIVIRGDINGDGQISALDLLQIKKHLLRQSNLLAAYREAGKITGQTDLSALDLLQLKKYLLGQLVIK